MDLDGQHVLGVEQLDQQRKSPGFPGVTPAENLLTVPGPKFSERFPRKLPVLHHTLLAFAVHHLPGLADRLVRGNLFSIKRFQVSATPDAGLEKWNEGNGSG